MRLWSAAVCAAVLAAGCQASFKNAAGGATSPDGMGKGVSRSLVFADEGVLLSRLGLTALAGVAAVGAVDNVKTTTNTWSTDTHVITETTTSATVNTERGQKTQDFLDNTVNAPRENLSTRTGGFAARLEIAGETLGGDTRGWQYDMGFNVRRAGRLGPLGYMLRAYVGIGYGNFSYNDRALVRMDRGPIRFADGEYGFGGAYMRTGLWLVKPPRSIKEFFGVETFATLSGNARGPSYVSIGERVQWALLFLEAEVQMSGTSSDDRSYVINAGVGFF